MEHDRQRYRPEPIEPAEQKLLDFALQKLGADGFGEPFDQPEDEMTE